MSLSTSFVGRSLRSRPARIRYRRLTTLLPSRHALLALLLPLLGLVGCGCEATAAKKAAPAAPSAESVVNSVRTFTITGNDAMRFSVTEITAAPGEKLRLTLRNIGSMPKAAMGHNLVVLHAGADAQDYAVAAIAAKATDYLPPALADQVLAATKMLGPGESDTIEFTLPATPGVCPFVCSFPAHFLAGMKGVIRVVAPAAADSAAAPAASAP